MAYTPLDAAFSGVALAPSYTRVADTPLRFNIMSTLAPSATVPGGVPLLTPAQLAAGQPWKPPPVAFGGCDKPPISQLSLHARYWP
jgi:hypothetical protein